MANPESLRPARRRPLLISYDLSPSGAPIALLGMAKSLRRLGEDPIVASLGGGPLEGCFTAAGFEVTRQVYPSAVEFVIANTVLTIRSALALKKSSVSVAAWVHEPLLFFERMQVSPQALGMQDLDFALVPSRFQLEEFAPFVRQGALHQLRNTVEQDSFRPDSGQDVFAVVGPWVRNKGQETLLGLLRDAGLCCTLKFIGARNPEGSARPEHTFLGVVGPARAKLEIASAAGLISCAETETQNLSAIEALMAGRPALLSDIEAHCVLAKMMPNVFLFDRASPVSFKAGFQKLIEAVPDHETAARASRIAKSIFGEEAFDERMKYVLKLIRGHTHGTHSESARVLQDE